MLNIIQLHSMWLYQQFKVSTLTYFISCHIFPEPSGVEFLSGHEDVIHTIGVLVLHSQLIGGLALRERERSTHHFSPDNSDGNASFPHMQLLGACMLKKCALNRVWRYIYYFSRDC